MSEALSTLLPELISEGFCINSVQEKKFIKKTLISRRQVSINRHQIISGVIKAEALIIGLIKNKYAELTLRK